MATGDDLRIPEESVFAAIKKQLTDTWTLGRGKPKQIRVTPLAIEGSVLTVPCNDDPDEYEILVHPEDWHELQVDVQAWQDPTPMRCEPPAVFGIPVVRPKR